jgi:hypothetical protein
MSLDKVLQKIQSEIKDLTPTLELFFEETIQPSVNDCENLQKQLTQLQENLAIYKYQKQNKELSPSFTIHAKLSEVEITEEKNTLPTPESKKNRGENKTLEEPDSYRAEKTAEHQEKPSGTKAPSRISVNLNDKFRFINELFAQNTSEYNIAMEQFNTLRSWNDAEIYLNSLKSLYSWEEDKDIVKYFYALIKKRFD